MRDHVGVREETPTFQAGAKPWQDQIGLPKNVEPPSRVHLLPGPGRILGSPNELLHSLCRTPGGCLIAADAQLLSFAQMVLPHARLFNGLALEFCGHRERIKNRTIAGGRAKVHTVVGTLTIRTGAVPEFPDRLTLYDGARNQMELRRRRGLEIARCEDPHAPYI